MAEKPEDLSLPASVVARIIKDALPEGVSVSKEARVAIGKAASVFILYCTACSNNLALQAKRKTLAASDVLSALSDMEFDEFTPELKSFLDAYKREQKGKREAAADRRKQKAVVAAQTTDLSPPGPAASQTITTGGSGTTVPVETTSRESSNGGGPAVTGSVQSGIVRAGEEEEAMETDTVHQLSGSNVAVISSVS